LGFEEFARLVPRATAFKSVPAIEIARTNLAKDARAILAAETLAYFLILTEYVIRNTQNRDALRRRRERFYNLQRRSEAIEDENARELAVTLRQQHTVQGIRMVQKQLFTAYPVCAGLMTLTTLRAMDQEDYKVMPARIWKPLGELLLAVYPTNFDRDTGKMELRSTKGVTDLLRRRLISLAGKTPAGMVRAIERSIPLFEDARRVYLSHAT